jgi:methylthioribose-1-phosphate isomerase
MSFETLAWRDGRLILLDQTLLPNQEVYREYSECTAVARAIVDMVVRGAPAIGVTAAFGVVLAARALASRPAAEFAAGMDAACRLLAGTRPTAVNLFWAIERMGRVISGHPSSSPAEVADLLEQEALNILAEDVASNRRMGRFGAGLLPARATVLTHCNAGALATAGYGTALGVIRAAAESGKTIQVFADETRPFLQGARLTAWELMRDRIPVTLITDNMAGYKLSRNEVDAVIVGADRVARNGDVANKIGTYGLAVLARENRVPFYVAAPLSTVDLSLADGSCIPIEERDPREVTHVGAEQIAPDGAVVWNPAFDVTPARLVTAIITDAGVALPPYEETLRAQVTGGGHG